MSDRPEKSPLAPAGAGNERRDSALFAALAEDFAARGLSFRFHASGQSMRPAIGEGEAIEVNPAAGDLHRGDILFTHGDDGFKAHRLVALGSGPTAFQTRGDASQRADSRRGGQIVGKVVSVERNGRRVELVGRARVLLQAASRLAFCLRASLRARARRLGIGGTALLTLALVTLLAAPAAQAQVTITVTDTGAPNPVATGANITFTEVVANTSGTTATNLTLTQNTPPNTLFVSVASSSGAWTCGTQPAVGGTGPIICTNPGNLRGGRSVTFTVVVQVSPEAVGGSTITSSATVTWTVPAPGGSAMGMGSVQVSGADISMTQLASATAVAPGATITYTETVTNSGPNDAVGVVLYQQTPPNTTFSSITPPAGWACGTVPGVGGTGQVICTDGANLTSGTTTTNFTYVVTVNAGTAAGTTIVNSADANSQTTDPKPSNNATTTSVLVEIAGDSDLAVSMTASPTPVFVSAPITYTILVTNLGLAAAPNVTLKDTLPAGLTGASAATSQGSCGAPVGGVITCNLGTVAYPLATPITITVTGTTPSSATTMMNVATVATTGTDPVAGNNTATVFTVVQPLVCATPGRDGAGGTLNGIVNAYYPPKNAGTVAAGSTSVVLGAADPGGAQTAIAAGDLLLVIQTQDAQINSTNTSSYGAGTPGNPAGSTSLGSSGEFEFVTATSAVPVTGGTLNFTGTGAGGGLLNAYTSAAATAAQGIQTFQVIRVPQYTTAMLSSGLTALSWNGATGGVLVVDVASQLTLGGTVALDGLGFRGGGGIDLRGATSGAGTDTVTASPAALPALPPPADSGANASKGEGVAGTPHWVAPALSTITHATTAISTNQTFLEGYPNGSFARGAPGNAGGGATDADPIGTPANSGNGNDQNSGGGGGANGGGGGQGGYAWNSAGFVGGFGGVAFPASTSAVVMGGGGGAGTNNNGAYWDPGTDTGSHDCGANCTGIYSSGAAGGGIFIVRTGSVTGSGTVTANGQTALELENDSGGGGGAGGTIIVFANSGGLAGLTASATGGNGGTAWPEMGPGGAFPGNRHGPGGGGGGGVVLASAAPAPTSVNVNGGSPGTTTLADDAYGATPGQAGVFTSGLTITQTPGTQSGAYCAPADLAITNAGTPNPVVPGNNITYTQMIKNNGPQDAVNAVFTEQVPANTTFVSLSAVAGWMCMTPALGGTGTITCSNPDFANGGNASFMLAVNVNAGTTSGTIVTDVASVSSGTNDPNLSNNTATVQTIVSAATAADEAITISASPNPVQAGGTITYTVTAMNNGPANAVNPQVDIPVVGPSTFQSVTPPAGWSCGGVPVGGTGTIFCTASSLASGGSAVFTVMTAVPAGTAGGTMITTTAAVGSNTPDPNPSNNSASTTVVVAAAGQADVAISGTVSPNPVLSGNNITYMLTVTNNGPSPTSAAAVMVTDTLPAGVTFVSATPTAGSCSLSAGVITCSLGAIAAGASVNITVVDMVNTSTAAGTKITSTFTASSSTSDPNPANNSVMLSTFVAVPNDADVAVTKSGSPNPVNVNTTLAYTIQVTNNGPAVGTNVVATDTLPSAVTYVSSSSTQGSCVQAAGTVTCTIGTVTVGQVVVVSITVTASTFSSSTLATNSVTITHSDPDPDTANNTATFTSTIQASTAVQLASFQAVRQPGGGVLVEWRTREESRNLGFHLYRLQGGSKTRLNLSLIAGAALTFRGGLPQHGAKTYRWLDSSAGTGDAEYELESVEMNGTRATHGPAALEGGASPLAPESAAPARSLTLTEMSQAAAAASQLPAGSRLRQSPPLNMQAGTPASISNDVLASRPAVKISIQHEGWYRVTQPELVAAGLERDADVRTLRLIAEGVDQPFLIDGRSSGTFGHSDAIEFYGTGIDTPFSDTRVYWLVSGDGTGEHIGAAAGGHGGSAAPASFPFTALLEQRTTYFAALLNGENSDNFFGALVGSTPVEQDLTVAHSDPGFTSPSLAVTLQGAVDQQEHRVSVTLNGNYLGEMDFSGLANYTQTFPLAAGQVPNGKNTVVLTALAGDNDYSLVQSIALLYGHTYEADGNWLRLTAPAGDAVQVSGFTNPQISVFDITNPLEINQVRGRVGNSSGTYSVTFTAPGVAGHTSTLLAFSADQIEGPAAITQHLPTVWGHAKSSADAVIISHADFTASLAPLASLRREQGHSVALVPVDDLYDEFNFGERSPFALRSFLSAAQSNWRTKPQSVLLVGDASFDPRNYLGLGDFDFVPTRLIETMALKTASDDWFSDFLGNGFATMPTGRLPVRTSAEAANVVAKIVGYETGASPGPWTSQVLLIGDANGGYDFTGATNSVEQMLPSSLGITKILADGQDPTVVHQQVIAAINSGQVFVNFLGHGSVEQWSLSGFFNDADATALTNGSSLPFVVSMDCLSGFFQDVYTTSLAETLLLAPEGGAVAVWASSGFTTADPQATMDRALISQFAANPGITLGNAILKAKAGTTDADVRRTWILFGDPAMQLRLPAAAPTTASH